MLAICDALPSTEKEKESIAQLRVAVPERPLVRPPDPSQPPTKVPSLSPWLPEPVLQGTQVPRFKPKKDGPLSKLVAEGHITGKPDYDLLLGPRDASKKSPDPSEPIQTSVLRPPPQPQTSVARGSFEPPSRPVQTSPTPIEPSPPKSLGATSEATPVPRPLQAPQSPTQQSLAKPVQEAPDYGAGRTSPDPVNQSVVFGPEGRKLTVPAACRAHVIAAIASEFSIPAVEQHLLQESSDKRGVEYYRVERKMDPRKLIYTQRRISGSFRDGRPIYQLLNDLNSQRVDPLRELEPLDVVWHEGFWRSLSNRRLCSRIHGSTSLRAGACAPARCRVQKQVQQHQRRRLGGGWVRLSVTFSCQ